MQVNDVQRSNDSHNREAVRMLIDVSLSATIGVAKTTDGLIKIDNNSASLENSISLVNTVISSELSRRFGGAE